MSIQKIQFTGAQNNQLAAALETPNTPTNTYALFAHCFTCTKDIFSARNITKRLVENGYAVMRFDFTGLGESEGDFENTNFSSNVADLVAAANYLRDNYQAPKMLIGHSLGGAAILASAKDIPEAKVVATIGAPADPEHVSHLFLSSEQEINEKGIAEVRIAGRPFSIKKQFLDDIRSNQLEDSIANLKKSLLVFHSAIDNVVGIDNARKIYQTAKHPKSFISLDQADHLLSKKEDAIYVSEVLTAWCRRYVDS